MKPKSFVVCIYEVRELVWAETFDDSYSRTVTMSDGTTREIKLTPVASEGAEMMEYNVNGAKSYMRHASTNINGDAENGKALMIQVFQTPAHSTGAIARVK